MKLDQKYEDGYGANIRHDEALSNYSVRFNRCYVEFHDSVIRPLPFPDPEDPGFNYDWFQLYDGQTQDLLAFEKTNLETNQQSGMIFDTSVPVDHRVGFEEAVGYISDRMKRDEH